MISFQEVVTGMSGATGWVRDWDTSRLSDGNLATYVYSRSVSGCSNAGDWTLALQLIETLSATDITSVRVQGIALAQTAALALCGSATTIFLPSASAQLVIETSGASGTLSETIALTPGVAFDNTSTLVAQAGVTQITITIQILITPLDGAFANSYEVAGNELRIYEYAANGAGGGSGGGASIEDCVCEDWTPRVSASRTWAARVCQGSSDWVTQQGVIVTQGGLRVTGR